MKNMKKRFKHVSYIPLLLIVVYILTILSILIYPSIIQKQDFVEVSVSAQGNEIYLKTRCLKLTMLSTESQILSIQKALSNEKSFRPDTHDLIKNMLEQSGMKITMARIDFLKENTYYAKLILEKDNKFISIDSRPSDAIAISLRANAPVYMNQSLLNQYGKNVCIAREEKGMF